MLRAFLLSFAVLPYFQISIAVASPCEETLRFVGWFQKNFDDPDSTVLEAFLFDRTRSEKPNDSVVFLRSLGSLHASEFFSANSRSDSETTPPVLPQIYFNPESGETLTVPRTSDPAELERPRDHEFLYNIAPSGKMQMPKKEVSELRLIPAEWAQKILKLSYSFGSGNQTRRQIQTRVEIYESEESSSNDVLMMVTQAVPRWFSPKTKIIREFFIAKKNQFEDGSVDIILADPNGFEIRLKILPSAYHSALLQVRPSSPVETNLRVPSVEGIHLDKYRSRFPELH
jgi:hypothetical protein